MFVHYYFSSTERATITAVFINGEGIIIRVDVAAYLAVKDIATGFDY